MKDQTVALLKINQPNQALPPSEESFLIELKETENHLLHFSLSGLSINKLTDANKIGEEAPKTLEQLPLMTRIYENLIGAVLATTESVVGVIKSAEPEISLLEVAQHDSFNDCWIVIYDRVYDVTKFLHSVSNGVGPAGLI